MVDDNTSQSDFETFRKRTIELFVNPPDLPEWDPELAASENFQELGTALSLLVYEHPEMTKPLAPLQQDIEKRRKEENAAEWAEALEDIGGNPNNSPEDNHLLSQDEIDDLLYGVDHGHLEDPEDPELWSHKVDLVRLVEQYDLTQVKLSDVQDIRQYIRQECNDLAMLGEIAGALSRQASSKTAAHKFHIFHCETDSADPRALVTLAEDYENGWGTEPDLAKALNLYERVMAPPASNNIDYYGIDCENITERISTISAILGRDHIIPMGSEEMEEQLRAMNGLEEDDTPQENPAGEGPEEIEENQTGNTETPHSDTPYSITARALLAKAQNQENLDLEAIRAQVKDLLEKNTPFAGNVYQDSTNGQNLLWAFVEDWVKSEAPIDTTTDGSAISQSLHEVGLAVLGAAQEDPEQQAIANTLLALSLAVNSSNIPARALLVHNMACGFGTNQDLPAARALFDDIPENALQSEEDRRLWDRVREVLETADPASNDTAQNERPSAQPGGGARNYENLIQTSPQPGRKYYWASIASTILAVACVSAFPLVALGALGTSGALWGTGVVKNSRASRPQHTRQDNDTEPEGAAETEQPQNQQAGAGTTPPEPEPQAAPPGAGGSTQNAAVTSETAEVETPPEIASKKKKKQKTKKRTEAQTQAAPAATATATPPNITITVNNSNGEGFATVTTGEAKPSPTGQETKKNFTEGAEGKDPESPKILLDTNVARARRETGERPEPVQT